MENRDRQLIERAKKVLMRYLGMSEPQAHRFLERNAMNLRMRKTELAKAVLKMYDLGDV
ncbi:MAG: ANTAR domain-containing protein [Clostridia bacterium]|nr:ANTAR domain-containing protein [Clostridia bacterium]